jgi:hypothetical protein
MMWRWQGSRRTPEASVAADQKVLLWTAGAVVFVGRPDQRVEQASTRKKNVGVGRPVHGDGEADSRV